MPYRMGPRLSDEMSAQLMHERRVVLHRQWRAEHKEWIAGLVTSFSSAKRVAWSSLEWDTIQDVIKEAQRRGDARLVARANAHLERRAELWHQRNVRRVRSRLETGSPSATASTTIGSRG